MDFLQGLGGIAGMGGLAGPGGAPQADFASPLANMAPGADGRLRVNDFAPSAMFDFTGRMYHDELPHCPLLGAGRAGKVTPKPGLAVSVDGTPVPPGARLWARQFACQAGTAALKQALRFLALKARTDALDGVDNARIVGVFLHDDGPEEAAAAAAGGLTLTASRSTTLTVLQELSPASTKKVKRGYLTTYTQPPVTQRFASGGFAGSVSGAERARSLGGVYRDPLLAHSQAPIAPLPPRAGEAQSCVIVKTSHGGDVKVYEARRDWFRRWPANIAWRDAQGGENWIPISPVDGLPSRETHLRQYRRYVERELRTVDAVRHPRVMRILDAFLDIEPRPRGTLEAVRETAHLRYDVLPDGTRYDPAANAPAVAGVEDAPEEYFRMQHLPAGTVAVARLLCEGSPIVAATPLGQEPRTDLIKTLPANGRGYHRVVVAHVLHQLVPTLMHLHSRIPKLLHRDLKPENILVFGTRLVTIFRLNEHGQEVEHADVELFDVKLGDFGLAVFKAPSQVGEEQSLMTGNVGTNKYMAPELAERYATAVSPKPGGAGALAATGSGDMESDQDEDEEDPNPDRRDWARHRAYGEAADMYSVGAMAYAMLARNFPPPAEQACSPVGGILQNPPSHWVPGTRERTALDAWVRAGGLQAGVPLPPELAQLQRRTWYGDYQRFISMGGLPAAELVAGLTAKHPGARWTAPQVLDSEFMREARAWKCRPAGQPGAAAEWEWVLQELLADD